MTTIEIGSSRTMATDETGASCTMETNTGAFSTMASREVRGSQVEQVTMKKFQENADEWSDTSIWPTGMLNILLRGVDRFIFGQFNFQNEEIDDGIYSYDHGAMELQILVIRFIYTPIWLPEQPKFHVEGGQC